MRSTLLVSILAAGLGGCGDHGLPQEDMAMSPGDMSAVVDMMIPNDAKKLVTFSMFAADFAQTICAHYMACGMLDAAQLPACIENNTRHTGWDQDVEIMKGRVEINELQCLQAVTNSRCDSSDLAAWTTRCLQFLYTGHQPNGATCIADAECATGYCAHAGSDAGISEQVTGCPGVCAPLKPAGATCRLDTACGLNAFCDRGGTNQCVNLGGVGSNCVNFFGVGTGPGCTFGNICPMFPASLPPTCVAATTQTALHGACDPFQGAAAPMPACSTGMYCQLQYSAGVACAVPADCTAPGSYCDTTAKVCKNPTAGKCEMKIASGANCDPNNEGGTGFVNSQCVDGATCMQVGAQTKPTCQSFGGVNADCTADLQCKIGLYCSAGGKCTAWFMDGQVCDVSNHCPSETQQSVCIADNADAGAVTTCQKSKDVGVACIPGFEDPLCEPSDLPNSTACAPNGSGGGSCAPKCY
ncbi:MAG TPA: hypothetical protein VF997_10055 [Polyangia bacterium]